MKRGQTDRQTEGQTLRLYEIIGLRADSLKKFGSDFQPAIENISVFFIVFLVHTPRHKSIVLKYIIIKIICMTLCAQPSPI